MGKRIVICKRCGEEFKTYKKERKYCSRECGYQRKGTRTTLICRNCNNEFLVPNSGKKRIFCSNKCYREYCRGENHYNYGKKTSDELKEKIGRRVREALRENKHGKLLEALRKHPKMKGFKYYILYPMPDAIAISEDGKTFAVEMERGNIERKKKRWEIENDFDGVIIFNDKLEVIV